MMVDHPEDESPDTNPIASGSMFIGLCAVRNTEAQLRWQGAQLAIVLNSTALVGVVFRFITMPGVEELVVLAIGSLLAAALNLMWYKVLVRDGEYLDLWNNRIAELEKTNKIEGGVDVFSSPRYKTLSASRTSLQMRLQTIAKRTILLWATIFVIMLAEPAQPILEWMTEAAKGVLSWIWSMF